MTAVERETVNNIPWWKEPTKDQWYAWWAAWLGWTLDAFDFTVFLLIMKPIADEFGVPVSGVAWILALTLWMRLVGAVGSGWLADRVGRKTPLMISIAWYSACNFIAGFSPTFWFLFLFRALLGIGMGAEWPAGAALSWAGECWAIQAELARQAVARTTEIMRELLARTGDYGCPGAQAAEAGWPPRHARALYLCSPAALPTVAQAREELGVLGARIEIRNLPASAALPLMPGRPAAHHQPAAH